MAAWRGYSRARIPIGRRLDCRSCGCAAFVDVSDSAPRSPDLLPARARGATPYLYSDVDLQALCMRQESYGRGIGSQLYWTLIGLLAPPQPRWNLLNSPDRPRALPIVRGLQLEEHRVL